MVCGGLRWFGVVCGISTVRNIGYLKGHLFHNILIQKLYIVFLLPWIVFLRNCPFLVK